MMVVVLVLLIGRGSGRERCGMPARSAALWPKLYRIGLFVFCRLQVLRGIGLLIGWGRNSIELFLAVAVIVVVLVELFFLLLRG